MSRLAELSYDIEQLYIDGFSPSRIANILECPPSIVYDWLEENSMGTDVAEVPQDAEFDPFGTINS